MTGSFSGRKVLITGSTRGIGHAAALAFLGEGADVVLHGRTQPAADRAAADLAARARRAVRAIGADLLDRAAQDRLAGAAGEIDIVVNCAGIFEERMLAEADADHWRRIMEVNLTAPWRIARALLPSLRQRQGVVVSVSSDSALLGYAGSAAYCASKGALIGLTRALAVELAPRVRVLCICPGPVDTDMMRDSLEHAPDPAAAQAHWESYTLLNRVAAPGEIAEAILFAAAPKCTFQTGSVIVVDGGATAGRKINQDKRLT
jgi:NAD(P)-dependent dehydrogenase (short-subunit alcohol dehydrogenase family)